MPPRDEQLLIIDLTGSILRAGVGVHDLIRGPTLELETTVAYLPPVESTETNERRLIDYIVGPQVTQAQNEGKPVEIVQVMKQTPDGFQIENWTALEALLRYVLHTGLALPRPPLAHPTLLSIPPHADMLTIDMIHQLMFEKLLVPQLLITTRPVLATAASGITAGLVLDVGSRGEGSTISVVHECEQVLYATGSSVLDEGHCDDWLAHLLLKDIPGLPTILSGDENPLQGEMLGQELRSLVAQIKAKSDLEFTSSVYGTASAALATVDSFVNAEEGVLDVGKILAEGKVDKFVKRKPNKEKDREEDTGNISITLNNGKKVSVSAIRHHYLEPLFLPRVIEQVKETAHYVGWSEYEYFNVPYVGIQEVIGTVVGGLGTIEMKAATWAGVVIIGSNTIAGIKAFGPALVGTLSPQASNIERYHKSITFVKVPDYFSEFKAKGGEWAVYLGGCILAKLLIGDSHSKQFISKAEYVSKGPAAYRLLEPLS